MGAAVVGCGLALVAELVPDYILDRLTRTQVAVLVGGVALLFVLGWLRAQLRRAERRARGLA